MAISSKQHHHYQHQLAPYTKPSYQNRNDVDFQLEDDSLDEQPMLIGGASVVRRNARERNRVKQVNNGFSQLRQHIPVAIIADLSNGRRGIGPGANKKLSKVSTLKMAVEYIRRLQGLIDDNDQKQQQQQQQQQHSQTQQQQHFNYQQQLQQQQQHFYALQQQLQLISPSGSCSSSSSTISSSNSNSNSNSYSNSYSNTNLKISNSKISNSNSNSNLSSNSNSNLNYYSTELKVESSPSSYEDYRNNSCSSSAEDEDILDYISLWQDDL